MNIDARAEVLKAHAVYEAAFNANDIAATNACLVSPFTFIGDGNAQSMNEFPFNPKEVKASKGWVSNEGTVIDLVAVGETKAHLVMRNTRRLRADGSLVEKLAPSTHIPELLMAGRCLHFLAFLCPPNCASCQHVVLP